MNDLSKKDAKSLIEIIHESLGCDTQAAYQRLVNKLQDLTGGSCAMALSGTGAVSGWNCSQASRMFPHSADSRTEVILNYALPHLRQALSRVAKDKSQQQTMMLSRREREVLQWMSEGKCTWDISKILRITERTVHYHSQNIMHKLEATSRSHAVTIAFKQGLIELH